MYNVYVKKQGKYDPDLMGEFQSINEAIDLAKELKEKDPTISYTIEEQTGHFNSYGDPISNVVRRG